MKSNSSINGLILGAFIAVSGFAIANADNYNRVSAYKNTPSPRPSSDQTAYNAWGNEIPPYAYSYVSSLPDDGHWRYVEERCYQSANGNTCVEGHWVRKAGKACEETTSHSVRTGNYVRIISAGRVPNCR